MSDPGYLPPTSRYADNDWSGANALTYYIVSDASTATGNGIVVSTGGTATDLTGATVTGRIYARRTAGSPDLVPVAPPPVVTGSVVGDPTLGQIALSVARPSTQFRRQPFTDWQSAPLSSALVVEPRVVFADGTLVTQGLQPLFVF